MTLYISKIAHTTCSYLADFKIKLITYDLYKIEQDGELIILRKNVLISFPLVVIVLSVLITGCSSPSSTEKHGFSYEMAPLAVMPIEVQDAPATVKQAYQFAVANPQLLSQLPCYCGCGGMGHTSNYSCYVTDESGNGSLNYDDHALGCSICVDITQDAMRMLDEGKSIEEIRAYVDQTYSRFGPSNMQ